MLAKKYRLTKKSDFQQVFKAGQKDFNKFFGIRYKINKLANPRVAVVASIKVSKKATDRNKIKRQTKSIIKLFLPKFKQNFDLIINILSPALSQKYKTIQEALLKILKKNQIL